MNYRTIAGEGCFELTEKKSRFIGRAFPVSSEEEVKAVLERLSKEEWDASHHVYAYRIYKEKEPPLERFSDDKEPSGTAGKQALMVLSGEDLLDTLIVVTRYFGGTLLGTGGLSKAYSASAKGAVTAAGYAQVRGFCSGTLTLGYDIFPKVKELWENSGGLVTGIDYADKVTLRVLSPEGAAAALIARSVDLCSGQLLYQMEEGTVTLQKMPEADRGALPGNP